MPSQSRIRFDGSILKAGLLIDHAGKLKNKVDLPAKNVFLHAALAAQVAAWDSYIKGLSKEYFSATSSPLNAEFTIAHDLLQARMISAMEKLNTPNSENAREFLINFTGFDPWPNWINIKFGLTNLGNSLLVRNRLNELFKVRHSFSHGFTMPVFSWNVSNAGVAHLDCTTLRRTAKFTGQLCKMTDAGMSNHIASQFGINQPW